MLGPVLAVWLLAGLQTVASKVTWVESAEKVVVQNGYVYVSYNKWKKGIDKISADFQGLGNFDQNNLADMFTLQVSYPDGNLATTKCAGLEKSNMLEWIHRSEKSVSFKVTNIDGSICDKVTGLPRVLEDWQVTVNDMERSVNVSVNGRVTADGSVNYVLHGIYTNSPSLYGLFPNGVAQMMDNNATCMGSNQPLSRAYVLGNGAAMDVLRSSASSQASSVVFQSSHPKFASGIEDVVIGKFPHVSDNFLTAWTKGCWNDVVPTQVTKGTSWSFDLTFIPNNYDFPAYLLNDVQKTASSVPFDQLRAYLTGIYGSPVGCLQSYFDNQHGIIAPTISRPDVGYAPDTNFFDPDNFISVSAMMYSGDNYLLQQVRDVLSRTATTMCGIGNDTDPLYCEAPVKSPEKFRDAHGRTLKHGHGIFSSKRFNYKGSKSAVNTRDGQLMHHYVQLFPTYESIAGSEQLGPNLFWTFSVLRYISISQDKQFAQEIFPYVDLSTKYVLTFYDENQGLFKAPGPLWIDVLVRENYTSDSNGMLVPFLQRAADFYDYMQVDPDFAQQLRALSQSVSQQILAQLWNVTANDHFVTQLNPDGTTRDFVDYDSNLMMVAFGVVTDPDQIKRVLNRVDSGPYTHIRATWCCEIPYSGDADDCYIVGGTVCGDSIVTLARIGWVDSIARHRVGDLSTYQHLLLEPLQQDLLEDIWLFERYDSNGTQIRTPNYFEYPSLVTMMLREVSYGIDVSLLDVHISPFPLEVTFDLNLGNTALKYSQDEVRITLPGNAADASGKTVTIVGMAPSAQYSVSNTCSGTAFDTAATDKGTLTFTAVFSDKCSIVAKRL